MAHARKIGEVVVSDECASLSIYRKIICHFMIVPKKGVKCFLNFFFNILKNLKRIYTIEKFITVVHDTPLLPLDTYKKDNPF